MKMPTWLSEVNPMSGMTRRDVMAMFEFKSSAALAAAIKRGEFPQADKATAGPYHNQRVWLVKTIKREIHRRNQMSSNVEFSRDAKRHRLQRALLDRDLEETWQRK